MKTKIKVVLGCGVLALVLAGLSLQAEDAKSAVKAYPLKTCVVSGEKLGEMGSPYVLTNSNREIKLCCKSCLKKFNKDEAGYVKKLEAAEAKDKKP